MILFGGVAQSTLQRRRMAEKLGHRMRKCDHSTNAGMIDSVKVVGQQARQNLFPAYHPHFVFFVR